MQIQPYENREVATKGERILVPGHPPEPPAEAPRLFAVFGREIRNRMPLLIGWAFATAVIAGLVIATVARPLYRAEGKLLYTANYRGGPKSGYTPPSIQTISQFAKSPEVLDPVREKHLPNMPKAEFAKAARIEISKQSELIDVSFDHPDPAVASNVANALLKRALEHCDTFRRATLTDHAEKLVRDKSSAADELERKKKQYRDEATAKGFAELPTEKKALETTIADIETQLRTARDRQNGLKEQIKYFEKIRDTPTDAKEPQVDDSQLAILQAQMNAIQAELQNERMLDEAKANVTLYGAKEIQYRPLLRRNVISQAEYDEVVLNLRRNEDIIRRWEAKSKQLDDTKKQYAALRGKDGKVVRRDVLMELDRLKKDLAAVPATISGLSTELAEKKKRQSELLDVERELGPHDEMIGVLRRRLQDFAEQIQDPSRLNKDVNADDLRVMSPAEAPATPYSSNAGKLALGVVAASAVAFLAYIAMFALPQLAPRTSGATSAPAVADSRPRALVALVPYIQAPKDESSRPPERVEDFGAPVDPPKPATRLPVVGPAEPIKKVDPVPPTPVEPVPRGTGFQPVGTANHFAQVENLCHVEPVRLFEEMEPIVPEVKTVVEPVKVEVPPVAIEEKAELPTVEPIAEAMPVEPIRIEVPVVEVKPSELPLEVSVVKLPDLPPVVERPKPVPRTVSLPPLVPIRPEPAVAKSPPAVKLNGPVRALAERIAEENVERGGIVLFAPTADQLRVTPVIGDLGKILTGRGDRVLVFDARPSVENPAWAGPMVSAVNDFLTGNSSVEPGKCFVPTALQGVEYSRGDLSKQLDGVMAAHRFRRLVEEMQERYSLVLMVSPPVTLDSTDQVLPTLADGMVLVAESTAPAKDIHDYIEALTRRVPAPLYGTLTVPRA